MPSRVTGGKLSPSVSRQRKPVEFLLTRCTVDSDNVDCVFSDMAAITVNRWQDLQQRIGTSANGGEPDDYNIPAVLRYQKRGDKK